jgi:anti-sigma regulatory factor (Ser/Thr protein kinase)
VKTSSVWLVELRRVGLLLVAAGSVGAIFDCALMAIELAISLILVHWFYQLWRIQDWLSRPETIPPAGFGVRGELFDRIYLLRRKENEARAQLQSAVDYRELYSAVSNLVHNAIKYSPDDSPVKVQWCNMGDECRLSVRDKGQGIAAVHLPRLTERFYRVDDSRSSATGGTGLGLAIVKHVAAAHNARLNIESVPGVGSSFSLIFPCTNITS